MTHTNLDSFLFDHKRRGWHFDAVDLRDEIEIDLEVAENLIGELKYEGRISYVGDYTGNEGLRPHYEVR